MTVSLSREERRELRALGWSVIRRRARRPRRIPRRALVPVSDADVLTVDPEELV